MSVQQNNSDQPENKDTLEIETMKKKLGSLEKFLSNDDLKALLEDKQKAKADAEKKAAEEKAKLTEDNFKAIMTKLEGLESELSTIKSEKKNATLTELRANLLKKKPDLEKNKMFLEADENTLQLLNAVIPEKEDNPLFTYSPPTEDDLEKNKPIANYIDRTNPKFDPTKGRIYE